MSHHPVVSGEQWLAARRELLQKEKNFSKLRDELTRERQSLPWVRIEKSYTFDGTEGPETLADLFGESTQLIVYHFMFGPDWPEGCKICSMFGDHYDPLVVHLKARDVALVTVSRAPIATLENYKRRMGWNFKWVSALNNDFNWDFHVSFQQEDIDRGTAYYNYRENAKFPVTEGPGISAFFKDATGNVFHTYSSYGRGLENFLGIYNFLDIVTKGRDEDKLPYGLAWVQHKDRYGDSDVTDPYAR